MNRVFLCMIKLHGYEKKIITELEKQGYQVEYCDYEEYIRQNKKIKNPILRLINNLYFRRILKRDLKIEKAIKKFNEEILGKITFGEIFIKIGTTEMDESTLKLINKKFKIKISHHWDTIGTFTPVERLEKEKKYYDKISSYDRKNCEDYNLKYLPNFYSLKESKEEFQRVYTIMSNIENLEILEKISKNLRKNGVDYKFIIVDRKGRTNSEYIEIQKEFITVDNMLKEMSKSTCILEINQKKNKGYTFRTFDCIGMKKKLITNNKDIINEDFYNPNNILVLDENNINIPKEFIDSPYESLPKEIYEKYSLKNWVKQLLEIE